MAAKEMCIRNPIVKGQYQTAAPREIQKQSICIDGDIGAVLAGLGEN